LEQIDISCYTEYKAFGPSLIYNIVAVVVAVVVVVEAIQEIESHRVRNK